MLEKYTALAQAALNDELPSEQDALWILDSPEVELLPLLQAAYEPRRKYFGNKVGIQILNNVQSGLCAEDCGYCTQRKDSKVPIEDYPMKSDEAILREAERAAKAGANRYCMVLSGRSPGVERTRKLAGLIRRIKEEIPIEVCLSAGFMDDERAALLAEAGLDRLNHNLNTSESRYSEICTTHTYAERIATIEAGKRHGLASCSGLIVGMGEQSKDIVEIAYKLRELEVPSIPANFLIPVEGNRIVSDGSLTPQRCLRVLALLRLINPRAEIRAAAGREGHLRGLESLALWPANSIFVEGYLTTQGEGVEATYAKIREAGFEIEGNPLSEAQAQSEFASPERYQLPNRKGESILKPEILKQELRS